MKLTRHTRRRSAIKVIAEHTFDPISAVSGGMTAIGQTNPDGSSKMLAHVELNISDGAASEYFRVNFTPQEAMKIGGSLLRIGRERAAELDAYVASGVWHVNGRPRGEAASRGMYVGQRVTMAKNLTGVLAIGTPCIVVALDDANRPGILVAAENHVGAIVRTVAIDDVTPAE